MDNVDAFDFTAELPANASQQQAWLWEQQSVQPELLEQGNGTLAQTDAHVKANHGVSNGNSSWRATSRRMGLTNRHGIGKRVSTTSMCSMAVRRVVNAALCPICAEPVKEAFLTPCGHTFCHGCLIKHLRASNRYNSIVNVYVQGTCSKTKLHEISTSRIEYKTFSSDNILSYFFDTLGQRVQSVVPMSLLIRLYQI